MEKSDVDSEIHENNAGIIKKIYQSPDIQDPYPPIQINPVDGGSIQDTEEVIEESLSLEDKEIELIKKALEKHSGKRKYAAEELGISERTLYRKIKEHDIEL